MSGPGEPKRPNQTLIRVAIWVVVGGLGLYLVISGVAGILSKGQ